MRVCLGFDATMPSSLMKHGLNLVEIRFGMIWFLICHDHAFECNETWTEFGHDTIWHNLVFNALYVPVKKLCDCQTTSARITDVGYFRTNLK